MARFGHSWMGSSDCEVTEELHENSTYEKLCTQRNTGLQEWTIFKLQFQSLNEKHHIR